MSIWWEWLGAVAFMTRLPLAVPARRPAAAADQGAVVVGPPDGADTAAPPLQRLAAWFPLAGLVVGGISGGTYWVAAVAGLPAMACAWAAVAAEMLVTGALHVDGLADVADGWAGTSIQRRLEIMKDPRLGTYGGVALFLALAGRTVLLPALPGDQVAALLMVAHAACRWSPVWALARFPYARPGGGTGAGFVGAGGREVLLAGATAVAAAWFLAGLPGLAAAAAAGLAGLFIAHQAAQRLGGVTGDVCGAAAEVGLLAALLVLAGVGV